MMMNTNKPTEKTGTKGITALYSRLSKEDALAGQSSSITNQMTILETYAKQQGFQNIVHFSDDGTSGVWFDRSAWQDLITEVDKGNVDVLILKDMSRWGRNYLEVGQYMELFGRKGIRFIALSNGIDSHNPESLEFAPFINIMSEWYARDTSRKIKTVARARGNAGKPLSYKAIYGYKKYPQDKHKWLIDEEAAAVVRRIFQMTMDGKGPKQIARILTEEKIEKPSYYFTNKHANSDRPSMRDFSDPYQWADSSIGAILKKPEYAGHTVNFRTFKKSYKDKHSLLNPPENWKIFYNTHEAIVSQEVFDTVQRLRATPRRIDKIGEANPLTGLVFCYDCGAKLYNSRQSKEYNEEVRFGKVYKHKPSDHYSCSTYLLARDKFKNKCSNHFIRTSVLSELILTTIREVSGYVRENEAAFIERIRAVSTVKQEENAQNSKRTLDINSHRIEELDKLFQRVYEDNATGKLSDERYTQLSTAYEQEQTELRAQNMELQSQLSAYEKDSYKADQFIAIVRRYTEFDELTPAMLNEFVERIDVHEADKSGGQREQQVDIHLNFIGQFEPHFHELPPPTEKELVEQEKRRCKLAYQREANQRWYAKKKREQEWQRALAAGEVTQEQLEAYHQEQRRKEEAERILQKKRTEERKKYAREWAKKKRAILKEERERLQEKHENEKIKKEDIKESVV